MHPPPKSATAGGAEINFRGAREVYLCELERGTGARETYPSLDQTNKVKTKKRSEIQSDIPPNSENQALFRPKTGDLKKKGLH